jgi:hypothetical protein
LLENIKVFVSGWVRLPADGQQKDDTVFTCFGFSSLLSNFITPPRKQLK